MMNLIALCLNGVLAVLLLAALGLGWRVERRLKALRDSHESFIRAVSDLDRAAARAEQGLADLRAATDEAAESLGERIRKAEVLALTLDDVIDKDRPKAPRPRPAGRSGPAVGSDRLVPTPDSAAAILRQRVAVGRDEEGGAAPPLAMAPRSRARVDDDLFDEPLRRTGGPRR